MKLNTFTPLLFIYVAVLGVPSALLAAAIKFYSSGRAAQPVNEDK